MIITTDNSIINNGDGIITNSDGIITDDNGIIRGKHGIIRDQDGIITKENVVITEKDVITRNDNGIITKDNVIITKDKEIITKNNLEMEGNGIYDDACEIKDYLSLLSFSIPYLSVAPLTGNDIQDRVKDKTNEVTNTYLPCVQFLVHSTEELRDGVNMIEEKKLKPKEVR